MNVHPDPASSLQTRTSDHLRIMPIPGAIPTRLTHTRQGILDVPSNCGMEGELVRKLIEAHTALGVCLTSVKTLVMSGASASDAHASEIIERSMSELERANEVLMRLRHRVGCKSRPWHEDNGLDVDLMP